LKKILVALALVILIVSSVSLLSAPQVKADPSETRILSYSWYVIPSGGVGQYSGDLVVVGEIQNIGSNVLGRVSVEGDVYNLTGGFLNSAVNDVYGNNLNPGQKAPFFLEFIPETSVTLDQSWVPLVTNVTVNVVYAADSTQTQYAGLVVPSGSTSGALDNAGVYTLTGSVQNTGNQATGSVWVVSTFYNSSGTVVALNYTNPISSSILPGKTATFTATPTDNTPQLSNSISSYSTLIQSSPLTTSPTPTPTAPITTPTPSTSPTSSGQPTPTASPRLGISAALLIYLAAAAIAVVLVILAVILLFRRRQRNAEFELPPPPPPT
jgi:hypothetical protein